jgi:hypothetical protein
MSGCKACGVAMVSTYQWNQGIRPEGRRRHSAFGLCQRCYWRARRGPKGPRARSSTSPIGKPCVDCSRILRSRKEPEPRHAGRGLCTRCHERRSKAGTLGEVPTIQRTELPSEVVLDEWSFLRDWSGSLLTPAEGAERLGMSKKALEQALYRARKKGDPRGGLRVNGVDVIDRGAA